MKKYISKIRSSKFKRFAEGFLFAVISVIALLLCQSAIYNNQKQLIVLTYYAIAVLSMAMGFVAMFSKPAKNSRNINHKAEQQYSYANIAAKQR